MNVKNGSWIFYFCLVLLEGGAPQDPPLHSDMQVIGLLRVPGQRDKIGRSGQGTLWQYHYTIWGGTIIWPGGRLRLDQLSGRGDVIDIYIFIPLRGTIIWPGDVMTGYYTYWGDNHLAGQTLWHILYHWGGQLSGRGDVMTYIIPLRGTMIWPGDVMTYIIPLRGTIIWPGERYDISYTIEGDNHLAWGTLWHILYHWGDNYLAGGTLWHILYHWGGQSSGQGNVMTYLIPLRGTIIWPGDVMTYLIPLRGTIIWPGERYDISYTIEGDNHLAWGTLWHILYHWGGQSSGLGDVMTYLIPLRGTIIWPGERYDISYTIEGDNHLAWGHEEY